MNKVTQWSNSPRSLTFKSQLAYYACKNDKEVIEGYGELLWRDRNLNVYDNEFDKYIQIIQVFKVINFNE